MTIFSFFEFEHTAYKTLRFPRSVPEEERGHQDNFTQVFRSFLKISLPNIQASMASYPVKITFGTDTRRFSLKEPVTFARLDQLTRQLLLLSGDANVTVRYIDDEGEYVSISSDEELVEAFLVAKAMPTKVLKLAVLADGFQGARSVAPSASRASSLCSDFSYMSDAFAAPQVAAQPAALETVPVVAVPDPVAVSAESIEPATKSVAVAESPKSQAPPLPKQPEAEVVVESVKPALAASTSSTDAPASAVHVHAGVMPTLLQPESDSESDDDEQDESAEEKLEAAAHADVVHVNITCDGCQQSPLRGIRYKCYECCDFDLCHSCHLNHPHAFQHYFVVLKTPSAPGATLPTAAAAAAATPALVVHTGVTCDGCRVSPIVGTRFKCTECVNFDLCETCEQKQQHDVAHPLLKMRRPAAATGAGAHSMASMFEQMARAFHGHMPPGGAPPAYHGHAAHGPGSFGPHGPHGPHGHGPHHRGPFGHHPQRHPADSWWRRDHAEATPAPPTQSVPSSEAEHEPHHGPFWHGGRGGWHGRGGRGGIVGVMRDAWRTAMAAKSTAADPVQVSVREPSPCGASGRVDINVERCAAKMMRRQAKDEKKLQQLMAKAEKKSAHQSDSSAATAAAPAAASAAASAASSTPAASAPAYACSSFDQTPIDQCVASVLSQIASEVAGAAAADDNLKQYVSPILAMFPNHCTGSTGSNSAAAAAAAVPTAPSSCSSQAPSDYTQQAFDLQAMGFTDVPRNLFVLEASKGNLAAAIEMLLK
jgi:hypothetical protein